MSQGTSVRPKRTRKDTPKIEQHRIEVKRRLDRSEVLKRSKAEREYFELEPTEEEYDSDSEIDLPDLAKFVAAWNNGTTRREPTKHVQTPKSHSASNMDDSETERVWAKENRGKGSHKPKMFSSTSKVHSNGPARPAISPRKSPKKSRDRSPSPRRRSSKDESTRGRSKHRLHAHDTSQDERGDRKGKKSTKKKAKRSHSTYSGVSSARSSTAMSGHYSSRASSRYGSSRGGSTMRESEEDGDDGSDDDDSGKTKYEDSKDRDEESQRDESDGESGGESGGEHGKARRGTGQKWKSGDFKGTEREILEETYHRTTLYLVTVNYFPDPMELVKITKNMWVESVRALGYRQRDFPIPEGVIQAIRYRLHSFRGRLRDNAVKAGLFKTYGLENVQQGSPAAEQVVDSWIPHELHRKRNAKPGTGYFQHEFLMRAACQMFFTGRKPLGKRYPEKFQIFPLQTLVIITTIIHTVLEAYKQEPKKQKETSKKAPDDLSLDKVRDNYQIHRKTSRFFEEHQRGHRDALLPTVYKYCVENSPTYTKPKVTKKQKVQVLTSEDFINDDPTAEELAALGLPVTETEPPPSIDPESEQAKPQAEPRLSPIPADDDGDTRPPEPEYALPASPTVASIPSEQAPLSPLADNSAPHTLPESDCSAEPSPDEVVATSATLASTNPMKAATSGAPLTSNNRKRMRSESPDAESPVQKRLTGSGQKTPIAPHSVARLAGEHGSSPSKPSVSRQMSGVILKAPKGKKKGPSAIAKAGGSVIAKKPSQMAK
ncbi:hypothetical protein FRC11_014813 [Ceratobasidium sp. 423]|nr:hypothetical protein FRC11_014813 [Ceratobasidium sp. 423]